jgi:predicted NUDIX family NTP pyrophosphohydrolase
VAAALGKMQQFPEADRAEWMNIEIAKKKILKSQLTFLENLVDVAGLT